MARVSVQIGAKAERTVRASLRGDGWTILATNWRGGGGELDVVALRDGRLLVVEVKARKRPNVALSALTRTKRRRLTAAVEAFLVAHPNVDFDEISFSVAILVQDQLEWWHDAFDAV